MSIINEARALRGDAPRDTNPEYERALVELTAHVLGVATDEDRPLIEALVLGQRPIITGPLTVFIMEYANHWDTTTTVYSTHEKAMQARADIAWEWYVENIEAEPVGVPYSAAIDRWEKLSNESVTITETLVTS